MTSPSKKFASKCYNDVGSLSTRSFAHGFRTYFPKSRQKAKRQARRLADVKEARLAWKEETETP